MKVKCEAVKKEGPKVTYLLLAVALRKTIFFELGLSAILMHFWGAKCRTDLSVSVSSPVFER